MGTATTREGKNYLTDPLSGPERNILRQLRNAVERGLTPDVMHTTREFESLMNNIEMLSNSMERRLDEEQSAHHVLSRIAIAHIRKNIMPMIREKKYPLSKSIAHNERDPANSEITNHVLELIDEALREEAFSLSPEQESATHYRQFGRQYADGSENFSHVDEDQARHIASCIGIKTLAKICTLIRRDWLCVLEGEKTYSHILIAPPRLYIGDIETDEDCRTITPLLRYVIDNFRNDYGSLGSIVVKIDENTVEYGTELREQGFVASGVTKGRKEGMTVRQFLFHYCDCPPEPSF